MVKTQKKESQQHSSNSNSSIITKPEKIRSMHRASTGYEQLISNFSIDQRTFKRFVLEIVKDISPNMRFDAEAMVALQKAAEEEIIRKFGQTEKKEVWLVVVLF